MTIITPVPKVSKPSQPCDFRPISITSVISRTLERNTVKCYIYPALQEPSPGLYFGDNTLSDRLVPPQRQLLLSSTLCMLAELSTNLFVQVFALDFSKAFDTLRHVTLMDKMAELQMPDQIFNWIKDCFDEHSHCTKYSREISSHASIQASVIQGSGLGPASYLVTSADLRPVQEGNYVIKFADDTYLIIPAVNVIVWY